MYVDLHLATFKAGLHSPFMVPLRKGGLRLHLDGFRLRLTPKKVEWFVNQSSRRTSALVVFPKAESVVNRLVEARFGKFFDELLAQNDLTAAEAARRLHVAQSQVSRWRRGEGGLSDASLRRIAEVFGTDFGFLQELTGTTYSGPSVYREESIAPNISARLDSIRQRLRELLEGMPPAYWTTYLESVGSVADLLATPYESAGRGEPLDKLPTRGRSKAVTMRPDRDVDRVRNAPIRRRKRAAS